MPSKPARSAGSTLAGVTRRTGTGLFWMPLAVRGYALTPRRLAIALAVLAVVVAFGWFRDQLGLRNLHDHATEFDGFLVFAALVLLPLLAFPVSVMHAMAGAKFGLPLGIALVGVSIVLQVFACYGIVRLFPKFFARRFAWLRKKLPPGTHRSLTLFALLLPGAPYFAQNYVLPVAGVPFRVAFRYSLPINFCRSIVGVIFGEWSGNLTGGRMAVFAIYTAAITLACGLAFRRLRAQLQNPPAEESDPTQCEQCGHVAR